MVFTLVMLFTLVTHGHLFDVRVKNLTLTPMVNFFYVSPENDRVSPNVKTPNHEESSASSTWALRTVFHKEETGKLCIVVRATFLNHVT